MTTACCTPSQPGRRNVPNRIPVVTKGAENAPSTALPGGHFVMGDDSPWSYPGDGEGPARSINVGPFALDTEAVSNDRFAAFINHTGYLTDAEEYGWSFVFGGLLPEDFADTRGVEDAPWWRQVMGAAWRHPEGPHSDLDGRGNHPVVQISAQDAQAFATWAGKRLPTEPEWEYAARAGSTTTFPWGEQLEPDGQYFANTWHGEFPTSNTLEDGWYATCPVDAFPVSAFGLHNMIGNVWEWTSSALSGGQVLKGGSYLCHASYCRRYRPAARSSAAPDSSMGNTGFRCARDLA